MNTFDNTLSSLKLLEGCTGFAIVCLLLVLERTGLFRARIANKRVFTTTNSLPKCVQIAMAHLINMIVDASEFIFSI